MSDDIEHNFPPRNLKTNEEILEYIAEHQFPALYRQGCEWFWNIYMPALERVAKKQSLSTEVIADNFYTAGDVHFVNDSPREAITYYKKALEFDPALNAAHREIASMYHRLGFIDAAVYHSDLALALWPDEKSALADRENIDADKNDPASYFEDYNTPIAFARDALAQNDAPAAINLLEGASDVEELRALTWAYGANQNTAAYLNTWRILVLQLNEIKFTFEDLFFMPETVWYEADIWTIWQKGVTTYSGVFILYEGLDETKSDIPIDENFKNLSYSDQVAQKIEYCLYCQTSNWVGLREIYKKYPNWKELKETVENFEAD